LLAGAGGLALAAVGAGEDAPEPGREPAPAGVLHGLYWLSANLARERTVVLAVDDAHWADEASLRFLAHLAEGIEELSILLLLAARPWDGDGPGAVRMLAGGPRATVLSPAALSEAAVRRLVGETLGEEVEEPFARACHRASAGNPFLLRELLGTLAEEGVRPLAAFAGNVRRTTPAAVSLSVQRRLRGLSAEAGGLARSVGVLGDRVRLPDAAGLAALGDPAAR